MGVARDYIGSASVKKQKLIDEKNNSPFEIGESISVRRKWLESTVAPEKAEQTVSCVITEILDKKTLMVEKEDNFGRAYSKPVKLLVENIYSRIIKDIGENPFPQSHSEVRFVAFSFESILFNLNVLGTKKDDSMKFHLTAPSGEKILIEDLNWNPYVYDKDGNKQYYQRDFVWSIKDKQLLIESIYQDIECGRILVRKRSWDELERMVAKGETEIGFNDVVDGKQRLNAVREFIQGKYPDLYGNYFADLSNTAQNRFTHHHLFSYAELPEDAQDSQVIMQFLKLNFAGVPQSQEHIDFVRELQKKM